MVYQKKRKSLSWNPKSQQKNSQFAPRPFTIQAQQDSHKLPTQEEIENKAFNENKFESFGLQLKGEHGTITPVEQERLGVLQAKMDSFWSERSERAKAQPNLLEVLIRNSQTPQTNTTKISNQPNTIQAKGDSIVNPLESTVEARPNRTGLPDDLKAGVENLSGYSLDAVKVHYNSQKPAQLQALAYAKGTEIHLNNGEEKQLPHEAWHVVQQMQGRVNPTMQMQGLQINNDRGLEHEADVMGAKALGSAAQSQAHEEAVLRPAQSTTLQHQSLKEKALLQGKFDVIQMVNRLYVGNLSFNTSQATLEATFAAAGEVREVSMPTDRETGQPRGFAFVTMGTSQESNNAIAQLNGTVVDGRPLKVNEAQERPPRGGGGGGGYGGGGGGRGGGGGGRGGRGGGRDRY